MPAPALIRHDPAREPACSANTGIQEATISESTSRNRNNVAALNLLLRNSPEDNRITDDFVASGSEKKGK